MKANIDYLNLPYPRPKHRRPEEERKKVVIVGPNCFKPDTYKWFCKTMDRAVFGFDDPIILVRGSSLCSCDKFAINWACFNWYVLKLHHPLGAMWTTELSACRKRDDAMVEACTHMVAFYDGYDPWVEKMFELARDMDKKLKLVKW